MTLDNTNFAVCCVARDCHVCAGLRPLLDLGVLRQGELVAVAETFVALRHGHKSVGHAPLHALEEWLGITALLVLEETLCQGQLVEARDVRIGSLVLLHDVLGGRVIDSEDTGSFFDCRTLHLHDADQVLALLRINLDVRTLTEALLSAKKVRGAAQLRHVR